jgi:hypothetical protein
VVLTVVFEIGLGRLVLSLPWERIAEDYDPARGGFLGLGLLFMAVSPPLAARLRAETTGRGLIAMRTAGQRPGSSSEAVAHRDLLGS